MLFTSGIAALKQAGAKPIAREGESGSARTGEDLPLPAGVPGARPARTFGVEDAAARERLFFEGDAYFDAVLADLDAARQSIVMETYIFEVDAVGRRICGALVRAAARGVRVRLIVDGVGSHGWLGRFGHAMVEQGVDVRVYHPLPTLLVPYIIRRPALAAMVFRMGLRLNRRDHRKLVLVDNRVCYVGSINVSADHSRRMIGPRAWRDTAVRLEDVSTAPVVAAFEHAWRRSWRFTSQMIIPPKLPFHLPRHVRPSGRYRLNYTRFLRAVGTHELLERIGRARVRVWLTNAYFVPRGSLVRALSRAAFAGVDVRLLVPRNSDNVFIPWISSAFYNRLILSGVRVYEYLPSMVHAKTMVIDDWCLIGSSNLNHRSLLHDLELDAVVAEPASKERLIAAFAEDLENAEALTADDFARRAWWQRWVGRMGLLFKNWM